MPLISKCCGTCRYSNFGATKHKPPRVRHKSSVCSYPLPELILPECVRDKELYKTAVWPDFGVNCQTWEKKL